MAKLILSMDGLVLKEITLDKERITIGRRPSNDVQINNLAISGEHAVVTTILDDSFLEDLDSTNGTQVNGKTIKKRVLHHNDVINMGKYTLKFLKETEDEKRAQEGRIEMDAETSGGAAAASALKPAGTASDVTANPVGTVSNIGTATAFSVTNVGNSPFPVLDRNIDVDELPDNPVPPPPAPAPPLILVSAPSVSENKAAEGAGGHAVLRILNGSNKGKELPLLKAQNTLGRTGIQVACITCQSQGYILRHIEGDHPPSVNNVPIKQEQLLKDGDVLEIIGVRMGFRLEF
jgi:pSer/pThr/pTyr-binding forkhead associated (FHA) protein